MCLMSSEDVGGEIHHLQFQTGKAPWKKKPSIISLKFVAVPDSLGQACVQHSWSIQTIYFYFYFWPRLPSLGRELKIYVDFM